MLPAGGQAAGILHFIDTTSGGMIGQQKKECPHYAAAVNRAGGLVPAAWKFCGLLHIPSDDPETTRKATQEACHDRWVAYQLASRALRAEPGHFLFDHRFIVDLEQNTPLTLQFWQTGTAQLCYRCVRCTPDVYSGGLGGGVWVASVSPGSKSAVERACRFGIDNTAELI